MSKEAKVKENNANNRQTPEGPVSVSDTPKEEDVGLDDDIEMLDDEAEKPDVKVSSPDDEANGTTLKRKRTSDGEEVNGTETHHSPSKRHRSVSPYNPPPPPPPPAESPADLSTPDQTENSKRKRSDSDGDEGYGNSAASPDKTMRPESPPPPPPPPPPGDYGSPADGEPIGHDNAVGTKNATLSHRDTASVDESSGDVTSRDLKQVSNNHATDSPEPSG